MSAAPKVSVVVPAWNVRPHLAVTLAAVEAARAEVEGLELIVVDDGGEDGSAELVARDFPSAQLLRNESNLGFTAASSRGLSVARGEYVLLLNADCELAPGALRELTAYLDKHTGHAAAAPRLLNPGGDTQRACMNLPRLATALWHGTPLERWWPAARELRRYFARDFDHVHDTDVEQPPGACLLVRRSVLERLGGLDGRMRLYFSDVDLSRRLADAGLRTRFVASATAVHQLGASTRQHPDRLLTWHTDRLAYYRKHHGLVGALWVKLCVLVTAADHLVRREARPAPVLRQVATLLAR